MTIKISNMIKNLEAIKEKNGDLECIYAKDDEGNGFSSIYYAPSVGELKDGDFNNHSESASTTPPNVVCIN